MGTAENVPCRQPRALAHAEQAVVTGRGGRGSEPLPVVVDDKLGEALPFRGQRQRRTARPGVAHDIRGRLARDAEEGHVDERRARRRGRRRSRPA